MLVCNLSNEKLGPADAREASEYLAQKLTTVQPRVAALVTPILDLQEISVRECGTPGTASRCTEGTKYDNELQRKKQMSQLLQKLIRENSVARDEALVVLMCFYLGESQEETDAVIQRGKEMIKYLNKYRHAIPSIPGRAYPASMLKDSDVKADDFAGAKKAIEKGAHSTTDAGGGPSR